MKISEFVFETQELDEIERLSPSSYTGGKESLGYGDSTKTIKPLPGGSGLYYSIRHTGSGDYEIKLWDKANKGEYDPGPPPAPVSFYNRRENEARIARWERRQADMKTEYDRAPGKLIGQLTLESVYEFPLANALQVNTITVDEDYRGIGLARALYGIVLTIMKRPLVAGHSQTPGGRKNWVSLASIPGVEMKGYFTIDDFDLETDRESPAARKAADQRIDIIMGQLGGQYIGEKHGAITFAFDVKPNTTGKELEAYVKTKLSQVYSSNYRGGSDAGLYAVWTGQG